MHKPTIKEIVEKLELVLDGNISREEVADWAVKKSELYQNDSSLSEEDITVWRILDTLTGIDLKDTPTEYLHNEIDIKNWVLRFNNIMNN